MFIAVQELSVKKPNPYGAYKILEAYSPFSIDGKPKYGYRYTGDRFERPIKTAYKITLHESYRESGNVKKRQYNITTINYYAMAEWGLVDCCSEKYLTDLACKLGITSDKLFEMLDSKIEPLRERIKAEFEQTEEYKTHQKHEAVIKKHLTAKEAFAEKYHTSADEYDYCYDVFGELKNHEYLQQIIQSSSYHEKSRINYSNSHSSDRYDYSSCFATKCNNYTDEERQTLKKFYRALAMQFHPDTNPNEGNTRAMQLLNRLKSEWDI